MAFKSGDVVSFKSGGHSMTVEYVDGDYVNCIWSDGKKPLKAIYSAELLMTAPPATLEELVAGSFKTPEGEA